MHIPLQAASVRADVQLPQPPRLNRRCRLTHAAVCGAARSRRCNRAGQGGAVGGGRAVQRRRRQPAHLPRERQRPQPCCRASAQPWICGGGRRPREPAALHHQPEVRGRRRQRRRRADARGLQQQRHVCQPPQACQGRVRCVGLPERPHACALAHLACNMQRALQRARCCSTRLHC